MTESWYPEFHWEPYKVEGGLIIGHWHFDIRKEHFSVPCVLSVQERTPLLEEQVKNMGLTSAQDYVDLILKRNGYEYG